MKYGRRVNKGNLSGTLVQISDILCNIYEKMGQNMDRPVDVNGNEQEDPSAPNYDRGRRPNTETPIRPFHPWELFEETIGSELFNHERLPVQPFSPFQWPNIEDPIHIFHNSDRGLTSAEVDRAMKKLRKEIYWLPRKSKERGGREERDAHHTSCSICLDEFVPRQQLLRLPCNHRFHSDCLMPWIKSNALCPFCRFDILGRVPANSGDHVVVQTV